MAYSSSAQERNKIRDGILTTRTKQLIEPSKPTTNSAVYNPDGERETERATETERDRARERQREIDGEGETERDRQRGRDRER